MNRKESDKTFTTDEVNADIASPTSGAFFALPNLSAIGVTDIPRAVQNYSEAAMRAKSAYEQGFFIEVINLRVQHAEMWLRLLIVHKKSNGYAFQPNDKRTFGQVIEESAGILPSPLAVRLRDFNRSRIDAVHKYLLGGTDYAALKIACDDFAGIDGEVFRFVVANIGRSITSVQGKVGEFIVHLAP